MLKIQEQNTAYYTSQPTHAELSGYFAAHWGNDNFVRPGYYSDQLSAEAARELAEEVIFAIAQHDNGWWETDALPRIGSSQNLPEGLLENLEEEETHGLDRWIRGIERFDQQHPYAGLLISFHAYWLYAPKAGVDNDPIFGSAQPWQQDTGAHADPEQLRRFALDLAHRQKSHMLHMRRNNHFAPWIAADLLNPHVRLLQTLDTLSLSLCSQIIPPEDGEPAQGLGRDTLTLKHVPRTGWDDLVDLKVWPGGSHEVVIDPYPFDKNPLPVDLPVRTISLENWEADSTNILNQWYRATHDIISFQFRAA